MSTRAESTPNRAILTLRSLERFVWVIPLVLALLLFPLRGVTTLPDSAWYLITSLRILKGHRGVVVPTGGYIRPVFPLVLAAAFRIFGISVRNGLWVVRAFYLVDVMLIYFLWARLHSKATGLVAALLVLTSFGVNEWSAYITLDMVLPAFELGFIALVFLALEQVAGTPRSNGYTARVMQRIPWWVWFVAMGISLAVACLVKETAVALLPLPFLLLLSVPAYRRRRSLISIGVFLIAFVLVLVPSVAASIAFVYGPETVPEWVETWGKVASIFNRGGSDGGGSWLRLPVSYAKGLGSYYRSMLAPSFQLAPFFVLAWAFLILRALYKSDGASWIMVWSAVLYSPLLWLLFTGKNRYAQTMSFILLSYVALAIAIVSLIHLLSRQWARIASGIVLVGLAVGVQMGLGEHRTARFFTDPRSDGMVDGTLGAYGFSLWRDDWQVSGWHGPEAREAGEWIKEHIPKGTTIVGDQYLLESIYFFAGGDHPMAQVPYYPSIRAGWYVFSPDTHERLYELTYDRLPERYGHDVVVISLWMPGLRTRTGPQVYALVEEQLLDELALDEAAYVFTSKAYNGLELYLETHPGFEEVASFQERAVRIFAVRSLSSHPDHHPWVDPAVVALVNETKASDDERFPDLLNLFNNGLGWSEYEARLAFAWSLEQQHLMKEAVTEYRTAQHLEPGRPEAYLELGELYERRGMWEQAAGMYGTALELDPGDVSLQRARTNVQSHLPRSIQHSQSARLADIGLLGYDLAPDADPGDVIELTLYWYAHETMTQSYTVFTHLVDSKGQHISGQDNVPRGGTLPTDAWLKDEVVVDLYQIPVPIDALPGQYTVIVGLYDASTLMRLPATGAGGELLPNDEVVLDQYVVVGSDGGQ